MFTGIIQDRGTVVGTKKHTIEVRTVLEGITVGESIAVNGVCLTVTSFQKNVFAVDVSPKTAAASTLRSLAIGDVVNLERAMTPTSLFGGHIVSGHVDTTVRILGMHQKEGFCEFWFELPRDLEQYVIRKGSVAIDGVSLTVAEIRGDRFSVWVVPQTQRNTTLLRRKIGDVVNFESDMIAKYVARQIEARATGGTITYEKLTGEGFL